MLPKEPEREVPGHGSQDSLEGGRPEVSSAIEEAYQRSERLDSKGKVSSLGWQTELSKELRGMIKKRRTMLGA